MMLFMLHKESQFMRPSEQKNGGKGKSGGLGTDPCESTAMGATPDAASLVTRM